MTASERLIRLTPLKKTFYDQHERRSYLRAVEIAKRLVDEPTAVARGRSFLETFVRHDARQRGAYREWMNLLEGPAEEVARALLADTEHGARLRDTAPVFFVIPEDQIRRIWDRQP